MDEAAWPAACRWKYGRLRILHSNYLYTSCPVDPKSTAPFVLHRLTRIFSSSPLPCPTTAGSIFSHSLHCDPHSLLRTIRCASIFGRKSSTMSQASVLPPSRPRGFRRLSSRDATREDLNSRSPTVVVPPQHLMAPSDAHEVAAAMEMARHELEEFSNPMSTPETPMETTVTDKYAFAFDIDGVLIRGGRPIPEAVEAMKVLNGKNAYGIKMQVFPYHLSWAPLTQPQPLYFRHQRRRQDRARAMHPTEQSTRH